MRTTQIQAKEEPRSVAESVSNQMGVQNFEAVNPRQRNIQRLVDQQVLSHVGTGIIQKRGRTKFGSMMTGTDYAGDQGPHIIANVTLDTVESVLNIDDETVRWKAYLKAGVILTPDEVLDAIKYENDGKDKEITERYENYLNEYTDLFKTAESFYDECLKYSKKSDGDEYQDAHYNLGLYIADLRDMQPNSTYGSETHFAFDDLQVWLKAKGESAPDVDELKSLAVKGDVDGLVNLILEGADYGKLPDGGGEMVDRDEIKGQATKWANLLINRLS